MEEGKKSLRSKVFQPVFTIVDAIFGLAMLSLVGAYLLRKYVEYVLTGDWGSRINVVHPSIRKMQPNQRRPFDGTSD